MRQRTRAFCYFCHAMQKPAACAQCGRTKCLGGDCAVRHGAKHATGMDLVGAVCDHCAAWVCHSRKCLTTHACACPLADMVCIVCCRGPEVCGGRFFNCSTCSAALCEEDQLQHEGTCTTIDGDSFKCKSCNRTGVYSCLSCKVSFCDTHVVRRGVVLSAGANPPCPKCSVTVVETKAVSVSTRKYEYGRHNTADQSKADMWFAPSRASGAGPSG